MAQFRGTVWPGIVVPEPPVPRYEVALLADELVVWRTGPDFREEALGKLPIEVAVRELVALDTASPSEVLRFVQQFGFIDANRNRQVASSTLFVFGFLPAVSPDVWTTDSASAQLQAWLHPGDNVNKRFVASALHFHAVSRYLLEAKHCALYLLGDDNAYTDVNLVGEEPPASTFIDVMNARLDRFHVRLVETDDDDAFMLGADLIDVLYLQLANLIAERGEFHRCPICANRFRRQRGRAQHDQHRTQGGLMYCSANCANTASTRAYRARKKSTKGTST